jgi:hypothetical protein
MQAPPVSFAPSPASSCSCRGVSSSLASVHRLVLGCCALLVALTAVGCGAEDAAPDGETPSASNANDPLMPCSSGDFPIPPPARPAVSSEQGKVSLTPSGTATVRFHGRTSNGASWVASGLDDLAYGYFLDDGGGQVSFDLRLVEQAEPGSPPLVGKPRTTTVRLSHRWHPGTNGGLCSSPAATLSVHETIDDESVAALPGTVVVSAFDPDARHLQVTFEAETTAYRIFVDVDVTGNVGAAR